MGRFSKLFAFTLAEAVIVLVLLSIIAAKIIPSVDATRPSTEKVLLKSAYSKLETAVSELMSNDVLYPYDEENSTTSLVCRGTGVAETCPAGLLINQDFDEVSNFAQNTLCAITATDSNGYFAKLLCAIMNPIEATCTQELDCRFTTPDGMKWTLIKNPAVTYTSVFNSGNCVCSDKSDNKILYTANVDVNGDLEPNTDTGVNIPDIYKFHIYYDGTIRILATPEEHTGRDILANPLSNKRRPDLEDDRYDGGH